jgi:hypothetical protein
MIYKKYVLLFLGLESVAFMLSEIMLLSKYYTHYMYTQGS